MQTLTFCHSGRLADRCFGRPFLHALLEGLECLHIAVSVQQAILVTACLHLVVLTPDRVNVRVAVDEVFDLSDVSALLFIDGFEGLVLPVQPRVFLFERVYLTVE